MTGRRAGYCAGYDRPGYARHPLDVGPRFGMGGGRGGRGWRRMYHATGLPGWARWGAPPVYATPAPAVSKERETHWLRDQAAWLKEQLDAIGQRLAELEGEGECES